MHVNLFLCIPTISPQYSSWLHTMNYLTNQISIIRNNFKYPNWWHQRKLCTQTFGMNAFITPAPFVSLSFNTHSISIALLAETRLRRTSLWRSWNLRFYHWSQLYEFITLKLALFQAMFTHKLTHVQARTHTRINKNVAKYFND